MKKNVTSQCSRCCSAPTAVCSNCQFSISPLIITNVTNITYHAQSNANANSNNSNKRASQLELARNAANKLLQNNRKVPAKKQIIVKNEIPSSSTAEIINKIYDLRIRPTQVNYERTPEMKARNAQQTCRSYNSNILVKETKTKQVRERYQNDESFKQSHTKKMQEKMQIKYNTDESFKVNHKTIMKQKYQTDKYYHDKLLSDSKNSYQTPQGIKRKSNYQNVYQASKKTKISSHERFQEQKREMPTVICTSRAQLFFKKSTVHELTLKINKSLRISDVCIYRSHLQENESGNVCSTCANHLKKGKVPHFAVVNGLLFEPLPEELTGLTTLEERLVSARIPFMQIRELGYQKQLGLKGNCVNVPIDINKTVTCLPRMDSEDDTLLVQLMRRMTDEDDLTDQQETLLTSGFVADSGIKIAPGEGNMPLSLTLDEDMDVLAFPTVYGGKQRIFKVKYTPVEMAKAEARSHDRRVATNIPKNRITIKRRTKILLPLPNEMNEQGKVSVKKLHSEIKEITEVIARTDEDCTFDEYLAYLNIDEQSYMMALRSKLKRPTVFLKRNLNERRITAYNREMLQLWEAHMDMQLVVSPYGCVKYIVSFVSKSEKEESCNDNSKHKTVYELKNKSGFLSRRYKRLVIQFRNYREGEDKLNFQRENLMLFTAWRTEPSLLDPTLPLQLSQLLETIQSNRNNYCKYDNTFDKIDVDLMEEDEENDEESTVAPQFKILDLNETPSDFQLEMPHTPERKFYLSRGGG
ncbi:Forkhead box protein O4 [Frankliniella fusca]|uniref:Forkhead box protein O4 n=1 Tax=Frankliniella fusca TaxID=407009 RepID=A0AAE1HN63_9NEOP|nr:Forkhead box protein O4 [Frankliniella fusca]